MRFILSAIALAAIATPAIAASDKIVTVRINYADIDLSSAQGRAELAARVDAEVREACTIETNSRYDYGRDIIDESCVEYARRAALAEAERVTTAMQRSGREVAAN